jgi:hypothetical protein
MSGVYAMYVIGEPGGYLGQDGVNPVNLIVLVGTGAREWMAPVMVDPDLRALGRVRCLVPEGPDHKHALLDACLAFSPAIFGDCLALNRVREHLGDIEVLNLSECSKSLLDAWERLRAEAHTQFANLRIWKAVLEPVQ